MSILTLFTVIAASRPVNKNVNTGAYIRSKRGRLQIELGVHKLLATIKPAVTSSGP